MPAQVLLATRLLWLSLGLGLVNSAIQWRFLTSQAKPAFVLIVQPITLALMVWLTCMVWKGRNWARITLVILLALGLLPSLQLMGATFRRDPLAGSLTAIITICQLTAMYLVFTNPGRSWFSEAARSEGSA